MSAGHRGGNRARASIRRWAIVALVTQVAFVGSWLVAALWQGPRYSVVAHSISDMYAIGAPRAAFLIVVITLCGAAVVVFAARSVWPTLRPAGWTAAAGSVLLALSIYGLGDLLTPLEREACRQADPGCTAAVQIAGSGGLLDAVLSTAGVSFLIAAGFFLAQAMQRSPGWDGWAWPTRWVSILLFALFSATGLAGGLGGLFERMLAAVGAAAIALLAVGVLRRSRARRVISTGGRPPEAPAPAQR